MSKGLQNHDLLSISLLQSRAKSVCYGCLAAAFLFSVPTFTSAQNKENERKVENNQRGGNGSERVLYRGVVVDDTNTPLPGVHVKVQGTKQGVATDAKGYFQMELPKKHYVFEFSYIGMKDVTVKMTDEKVMTIRMEEDSHTLKETVVTGIYTRNIESFTGAVSTFTNDDLKSVGATNVLRSLSILDPSFILTQSRTNGSNPNMLMDVSINGKVNVTDLSQQYNTDPNQPLFILDGFESSLREIQDLNMDRVESISILKDAASTAIYGSKAANGVVVVETRKPKQGKLRFSYTGNYTFSWPDLTDYNLMNAAEKLEFEKLSGYYAALDSNGEKYNLDGNGEIINLQKRALYYAKLQRVKEGLDTYWLNEPLRNGFNQAHNVYIDGGDKTFLYGVGLSYNKTTGVMKKSDRDVLNGNIRLTYRLKNLQFTNQTTFSKTSASNNLVPFSDFSRMNPFYKKRTDEGEVPKYVDKSSGTYIYNPLWDFNQNSLSETDNTNLTNNFQIEVRFLESLRLRGNVQYSLTKSESETFRSPNETQFVSMDVLKRGTYRHSSATNSGVSGRVNLTYGRTFGLHTVNAVAGMQFSDRTDKSHAFSAQGYSTDQFANPNFSKGYPENGKPSSTDNQNRSASYYANFNYSYRMRYLADFNYTTNGSSRFGINDPFTTTWSVGVGWNVHEEAFLKDNEIVNYLKLRYSWGNPGNENYDAKLSSSIYSYVVNNSNPFGLGARVSTWGNNNLKWQRTNTHNWGLDMTLFENRLNFTVNYQIRKTDPMLVRIDLPASTGATTTPMNVGATDNRSISASLTYYILRRPGLNWYISANGSHNSTKYYNIGNLLEEYNKKGRASSSLLRYYDGASTTGMYVVQSAGIDPATGNEIFIKPDGTYTYEWKQEYEVLYGDTNPKVQGSFTTSFVWKDFTFGASFRYNFGADVQLSTLLNKVENIKDEAVQYNQDRRALHDRWKKPGDHAKFKRIDDTSTTYMSSRFVAKENTVECSTINIGYRTANAEWLKYIGATSVSFTAYMNDIFRISTIKEERGTDYPFERSITFSVGLNF